jgi:predicted RNase H-like HicB family nuclease
MPQRFRFRSSELTFNNDNLIIIPNMAVHDEVLAAARRLGAERGDWTFTPDEVVRALPHLNASTVRNHVTSRCCENAPLNHPHGWSYFERVARGIYRVLAPMRGGQTSSTTKVSEARAAFGSAAATGVRDTIHGFVSRSGSWFVAECLEVAVVTQGRTLDETVANLKEGIVLHLEGEDLSALGLTAAPRLVLTYETSVGGSKA